MVCVQSVYIQYVRMCVYVVIYLLPGVKVSNYTVP